MGRPLAVLLAFLAAALPAAAALELRVETRDWVLTAPDEVGTQQDLDLLGRAVQLCTDEIVKLLGHRPAVVPRFTMQWAPAATRGTGATQTGIYVWYRPGFRIADPAAARFRESLVAQGLCFGPHEQTHVLSWGCFRLAWASEGFAEYTDRLYDTSWRCCGPSPPSFRCDATGYARYGRATPYADLSPFWRTTETYNTAACFWWEAQRIGGFAGLRALLASMRSRPPLTTGELVIQHANPILGSDMRPFLLRYGFSPEELVAAPRRLPEGVCTRIGTAGPDTLTGTRGRDVLCGLGGADTFRTRDGVADFVRCGAGKDVVVADGRDRVAGCEVVHRR